MSTYRIVVGVDGSEGSRRALRWAAKEAAGRGGTVEAVAVWNWEGPESPVVVAATPSEARQWAERDLKAALDEVQPDFPDVTIASTLIEGRPPEALAHVSADADLLALGSHGHGRLFHAVLGSVSEECVRRATCPVVVVPVPRTDPHVQTEVAVAG